MTTAIGQRLDGDCAGRAVVPLVKVQALLEQCENSRARPPEMKLPRAWHFVSPLRPEGVQIAFWGGLVGNLGLSVR